MDDYPKELQKKVTLLNHFKNYLEGETNPNEPSTGSDDQNTNGENKGENQNNEPEKWGKQGRKSE